MTKPMSKMLKYTGIFFAIVFGWYLVKKLIFMWFMSHYTPPPMTISTTTATTQAWQSYSTAVGTLNAVNGVELSSDVPGIVDSIRFNSGQLIHRGDVVIVMRTTVEQANLKNFQAKLQLAEMNYNREKELNSKHVSSQSALDTRYAELLEAQADVESVQAQIKQKTITAPFDGRLGIRQVNVGQFVSPGTAMVTLQSLNPLYINFSLPEQNLAHLFINQDIDVNVNYGNGKTVRGKITAINPKVDQITRNVLIQATIPNEKYELFPGMYGLVKIWFKDKNNVIVVPQTAISYSLSGDYVFIVKDESKKHDKSLLKAYRQYVKVSERRGDQAAIVDGLQAGDVIVTSGQLKLQNGANIEVDNSIKL